MDKINKLFRTILTTGLAFVINFAMSFVLTSYVTNRMGAEAYGFVTMTKNFAQYATFLTIALNDFATRYIALSYHVGDTRKANEYHTSVFMGNVGMASVILLALVALLPFLNRLLNIPEGLLGDVQLLFFLAFLNFGVTTSFSIFNTSAVLENKMDRIGVMRGVSYLAESVVLVLLYTLFPPRIFYVGIGVLTASLVVGLANYHICRKHTPSLRIRREQFSFAAVRTLVSSGIWSAIAQFGSALNSGLDLLVCNLLLTPLAMGQVAIAKTMETQFVAFYYIVAQAFQPLFLRSYAHGEREKLLEELKLSMKISGLLANLAFSGFAALGLSYFRLWIPTQDIRLVYSLTLVTLVLYVPNGMMTPLYQIYTLTVRKKLPCVMNVASGLLNVAGMYGLIRFTTLGPFAVVWTTTVIMGLQGLVFHPLYMAHCLKMPWYTFYPSVLRQLAAGVLVAVCFRLLGSVIVPEGWGQLLACIPLFCAVGAALHLAVVCDRGDWQALKRRVLHR